MVKPKSKEDYYHYGNYLLERNQIELAEKAYKKSVKMNLSDARLFNNLGIVQKRLGKIEDAERSFTKAIELDPKLYGALNNLGNINILLKDFNRAKELHQKAILINPYFKDAYNNLGTVWQALGQLDKAEENYKKALEINPTFLDAYNNLGSVYQYQGNSKEAIEYYKQALNIDPNSSEVYYNIASAYDTLDIEKSIEMAKKAVEISPDYQDAYYFLIRQLQVVCEWDEVKRLLPKLKKMTRQAIDEGIRPGEAVFFTIINWDDPKRIYEVAKAWDKYITEKVIPYTPSFVFKNKKRGRKLKIGYISSDFRNHVIAHQTVDIYKYHDKEKFEIYTYAVSPPDKSYFRKQIIAYTNFSDLTHLGYTDAAKKIHDDGVDILVDLNGYTKGARLEILALKPAPIQITYLGFPSTTASSFFDYAVVDKVIVPKRYTKYYTEKLIIMPDCYQMQSYSRFNNLIKPKLKITSDPFIFCCFNNNYKITQTMFDTWIRILKRVPNSLFWILDERPITTEKLLKYAGKKGVDVKRIIPLGRLNLKKHLLRLTDADLALDTYPYNGGATTSNALYAGVPVVTLQGKNYVTRMSSSLLTAAGIPDLITHDLKSYEDLAVFLAKNKPELDTIKTKLIKGRRSGPLFNGKLFVSNLEKEYENIWNNYINETSKSKSG